MTSDLKRCPKCREEKPQAEFGPDKKRRDGLHPHCRSCVRERRRVWRERNASRIAEYHKNWREQNKDQFLETQGAWREQNAEKMRQYRKGWEERNWDKVLPRRLANNAKRRAGVEQRACLLTPAGEKKIQALYGFAQWMTERFGTPYHVDHIVPLFGETCSGLHHPDNLRVVPAQLNLSKSNKIDYELVPHAFRPEEN